MTERTRTTVGVEEPRNNDEDTGSLFIGDDEEAGLQPDATSKALVIAFGQNVKTLREREGLDRETFGARIGYSAATVASYEQGRRIMNGKTIDKADEVLRANGLLSSWKGQMERAQYPATFQGMAALEKLAMELLKYDTLMFPGLLQTPDYMRALMAMRRPLLDDDIIEQRVAARMARQEIFDRWPTPYLGFIIDEAVLLRPHGGIDVLRGQLEHVLLIGQKRNVEIQVMPLDCEENAGVTGPFTVLTRRRDGKQFLYSEVAGVTSLQTEPEQTTLAHTRYGIMRSQALSSRESTKKIEGILGSL
ncbi:Scr1 family TA system antitoxin-like transcriptional regulator [Streptomyces sp. 4F14]|uniref:Scr1 family TA system antitoxin-like transcriptional regulator n=1 Tax=Streptomyces sp. 4F14 TaxID=3394380 RepID=UPI003A8446C7